MNDWYGYPPGAWGGPGPQGPGPAGQAPGPGWGPGPGWSAAPAPAGGFLNNPRFVRGALVGAVAAYLLTNEDVQQATIKTLVRLRSVAQGGFEELKERFRDAEAELHAAQARDPD